MRDIGTLRTLRRRFVLGLLALSAVMLPDGVFSIVTQVPWELSVLRLLGLVGISVAAALPWASGSHGAVRQRLRWWSIPGVAATGIYLLSTDPVYLIVGFCLLTGAAIDVWMTRAHVASETLRVRLMGRQRFHR